jgi:glycerate kinase
VHVLVAPDKFKGSLSAAEATARILAGLRTVVPGFPVVGLPIADGGEGTVDAAVAAGFTQVPVRASGPTGRPVVASYALRGSTAVIELAGVCGLPRLPGGRLAPLEASSLGLGEVVRAVIERGCRRVVLGIGGSASTDGGLGLLQALGALAYDAAGEVIPAGGSVLRVASVDLTGLHPALTDTELVLATDVDNPLYGPTGAAATFAPQKGATADEVAELDEALRRWATAITHAVRFADPEAPGAGAAGGVGFAAASVLGAQRRRGIDVVLDLLDFAGHLEGCRLVITGEGSLDEQSLAGKAPIGVARVASTRGVPVVALVGRNCLPANVLRAAGVARAYALTELSSDLARCIAEAGPMLEELAATVATDWLLPSPHG